MKHSFKSLKNRILSYLYQRKSQEFEEKKVPHIIIIQNLLNMVKLIHCEGEKEIRKLLRNNKVSKLRPSLSKDGGTDLWTQHLLDWGRKLVSLMSALATQLICLQNQNPNHHHYHPLHFHQTAKTVTYPIKMPPPVKNPTHLPNLYGKPDNILEY